MFVFLFIVTVAPQITTQPHAGSVTEGDNVTLSCNASGNPVPTISWSRDDPLSVAAIKESVLKQEIDC